MRKKRKITFIFSILYCLFCTGCSKSMMLEERPQWHIGVVLKTMDSEHWLGIQSGMENTAKQYNIALSILYPSNEWAEEEQKAFIDDLLESDIDALIVAPCNSTNTGWFADKAAEKGILLFTADTRSLDRDIPYIGADNRMVGQLAAKYLEEHISDKASKVAVIAGGEKQAQTVDRVSAFEKSIHRMQPKKEVTILKGNSGFADALNATKELIKNDVSGIFCASAVMGLGASAAEQESNADLCIVTVDTQDDALKAVRQGAIDALITQSGYEIGQKSIETVVGCLEGKPQEDVFVSCEVLTRDTIDDYLERRGNQE